MANVRYALNVHYVLNDRNEPVPEPDLMKWARDAENIIVWLCGILLDTGEIIETGHGYPRICVPFCGKVIQDAVPVPCYNRRLVTRVESGISAEHARKLAVEARQAALRNAVFDPSSVDLEVGNG